MHRIDTATKATDLFGAGKHGFKDGNPASGDPATALNASFFNDAQEELCGIVEAGGLALNAANHTQVLAALRVLAPLLDAGLVAYRANKPLFSFIPDNTASSVSHLLMSRGTGAGAGAALATVGDAANGTQRLQIIMGLVERLTILQDGNVGINSVAPSLSAGVGLLIDGAASGGVRVSFNSGTQAGEFRAGAANVAVGSRTNVPLIFEQNGAEAARFDISKNFLVGNGITGSRHMLTKAVSEGGEILYVQPSASLNPHFSINAGQLNGAGFSAANSVVYVTKNSSTSRSINAAGTVNASGADVAEYYTKAVNAGSISAGQVCGVDANGRLVTAFDAAVKFRVKSTNPHVVGNDTWSNHLGDRPAQPSKRDNLLEIAGLEPKPNPIAYPYPEGATPEQKAIVDAANEVLAAEYEIALAAWEIAENEHLASEANWHDEQDRIDTEYEAALADWEQAAAAFDASLEVERVKVDRMAMNGRVPLNITGSFNVGDYVIPNRASDGSIEAIAISPDDLDATMATGNFKLYRSRVGQIEAVLEDGRPFVEVHQG